MIFICLAPQYKIVIWRDAATLRPETALIFSKLHNEAWKRGQKSQRFHAPIKMLFDYQSVAKTPWPRPDMNDVNPDGDGGWSRHWLPKGDPRSG